MHTKENKRTGREKPTEKSALFAGLSKPAQRAFESKGIKSVKQLSKFTEDDILKLHGIGRTAIPFLRSLLRKGGLTFKKRTPKTEPAGKGGSVDQYLASLPADARKTLSAVRKAIFSAAPEAEEKISYGVPFYRQNGHLTAFLCAKNNCSLVTMSYDVIKKFKKELEPYKISGTTIHFPFNSPLPSGLVKKIIKQRLAENDTKRKLKNKNK